MCVQLQILHSLQDSRTLYGKAVPCPYPAEAYCPLIFHMYLCLFQLQISPSNPLQKRLSEYLYQKYTFHSVPYDLQEILSPTDKSYP